MSLLTVSALGSLAPASKVRVKVELTDGRGDPVAGFGPGGVYVEPTVVTLSAAGGASLELTPNSVITPTNTYYTVTIGSKSFLIEKSGATQTVFEALVAEPQELTPVAPSGTLLAANNLSDLIDTSMARDNLGLGNSATLNVGSSSGTVAAGDDVRFTNNEDHRTHTFRDAPDQHPAAAVTFTPYLGLTATEVQTALQQVYDEAIVQLNDASEIAFTPTGTLTSTNVQAAIVEARSETQPALDHITATPGAHAASAISFIPSGGLTSTDVQAALIELLTTGDFVLTNGSYVGAGTDAARFRVTGDSQPRFTINGGGILEWGSGAAVADTNLYRDSANTLKTDYSIAIGGNSPGAPTAATGSIRMRNGANVRWRNFGDTADVTGLTVNTSDDILLNANATNSVHLAIAGTPRVTVDAASMAIVNGTGQNLIVNSTTNSTTAAGGIAFGLSQDTNLYRSAANTLKTDDSFVSAGSIRAETFLQVDGTAATTGFIRLPNNDYITFRNAANTLDVPALKVDGSNNTLLNAGSGSEIFLQVNGTTYFGVGQGYIRSGTVPATSGALRMTNNEALTWRDSTNTSNVELLKMNASNDVILNGLVGANLRIQVAGSDRLVLGGGGSTYVDGAFFAFGTTLGSKIGSSTTQKIGFWNATPVVQPTALGTSAGFAVVAGGSSIDTTDTMTGGVGTTAYTVGDIVRILKTIGLIAT